MKVIRKVLIIILVVAAVLGAAIIITTCFNNRDAANKQNNIRGSLIATSEQNVYITEGRDATEVLAVTNEIMNRLPDNIAAKLKSQWVIAFVEGVPSHIAESVGVPSGLLSGCTMPSSKTICIFVEGRDKLLENLAHEIGHSISHELGGISKTSRFMQIYLKYQDAYVEYNNTKVNAYHAGTPDEYFAMLFEEYLLYPDYLKKHCPDGFSYFQQLMELNIDTGFENECWNLCTNTVSNIKDCVFALSPTNLVENVTKTVKNNSFVNPNDYTPQISFAGMSEEGKQLLETIFDAFESPDSFEQTHHMRNECRAIVIKHPCDDPHCLGAELDTFMMLYFGERNKDVVFSSIKNSDGDARLEIYIPVDAIAKYEQIKKDNLEKIEGFLRTIKEGSETEKLVQISHFIANYCEYDITAEDSLSCMWESKSAKCLGFSMMFKQFSERLGIPCDVVVGYSDGRKMPHAWNRVKLSDGSYRYYDVTWYGGYDDKYLDSVDNLHTQFYLNDIHLPSSP